jgi:hypothetical protein
MVDQLNSFSSEVTSGARGRYGSTRWTGNSKRSRWGVERLTDSVKSDGAGNLTTGAEYSRGDYRVANVTCRVKSRGREREKC